MNFRVGFILSSALTRVNEVSSLRNWECVPVTPRNLSKIDRGRGSLDDPLFFVATVVEIVRGIEECYNLHSNYISRVGG